MTVYRVPIGSSVSLVDATDPEEARAYVAQQLGYRHKPWLVRDLPIREATTEEVEAHKLLGGKVAKAKIARDPSALPVDERRSPTEPADDPPDLLGALESELHRRGVGRKRAYPDGLPEDLYVDIESTIHQHCRHDGQSDDANDWVTDLMSALTPLIVRALVDGQPAPPLPPEADPVALAEEDAEYARISDGQPAPDTDPSIDEQIETVKRWGWEHRANWHDARCDRDGARARCWHLVADPLCSQMDEGRMLPLFLPPYDLEDPGPECTDSATADGRHCKCERGTCCWCGVERPPTVVPIPLDDSGPATPGPTREQVVRTVRSALVDGAGMPSSWFPEEGQFVTDTVADAVMALFGRSAPEPPPLAELIAAKAAEIDAAGLGFVDPIHQHARCTCSHSLASHSRWDKEDEHLTCNVGDCDCEGWTLDLGAPEPPETQP